MHPCEVMAERRARKSHGGGHFFHQISSALMVYHLSSSVPNWPWDQYLVASPAVPPPPRVDHLAPLVPNWSWEIVSFMELTKDEDDDQ
jgi:hypothetical protein